MSAILSRVVHTALAVLSSLVLFACSRDKPHGIEVMPEAEKSHLIRMANSGDWRAANGIFVSMAMYHSWGAHTDADIYHWQARVEELKNKFKAEAKAEWGQAASCVAIGEFGLALPHYRAAEEFASDLVFDETPERIVFNLDLADCLVALGRSPEALPLVERASNSAANAVEIEDSTRTRASSLLAECKKQLAAARK